MQNTHSDLFAVIEGGDIAIGLRVLWKLVRRSWVHIPPLDADLDSSPKTIQGEGDDEEGEWGGGSLYTIGNRLADRALAEGKQGSTGHMTRPTYYHQLKWNARESERGFRPEDDLSLPYQIPLCM